MGIVSQTVLFLSHDKVRTKITTATETSTMTRSVLIAVDGSENCQRAFDFYVSDIRHADDVILLCHIQHTPHLPVVSISNPLSLPTEDWTAQIHEEHTKSMKV